MKKLKITFAFALILLLGACDVEYFDNPNEPVDVPTSALFNNNTKRLVDAVYDMWWSGRFSYVTMQYWHQTEYGDEDRYGYRESMRNQQSAFYEIAENYRVIIQLNTDEETASGVEASGSNANQIATCRVMLAYLFDMMVSTWGDLPYYSTGSDNANFQALKLSGAETQVITPVYASQAEIFEDILSELAAAYDQFDEATPGMSGDNIYGGDVASWKKFAASLRYKIAHKIEGANSGLAATHIAAAAPNVFSSNADNAMFAYETTDANSAPPYDAWYVGNRSDFAVGHSFVTLLKGEDLQDSAQVGLPAGASANPFSGLVDPRLPIYAQPNANGEYVGMFIALTSAGSAAFTIESLPGTAIIEKPDFAEALLEYSEIAFIQSERAGWSQAEYEAGITASMEKWGVPAADITAYLGVVPAASEENVLTQKYIALYMDGHSAWMEYRRTGFPKTLIQPHSNYAVVDPTSGKKFAKYFPPIVMECTDLPFRMEYPQIEQVLNEDNRKAAVDALSNGDVLYSKLWWDVN